MKHITKEMKTCEELIKKKHNLQSDIKKLINSFIEENGGCDISIDVTSSYMNLGGENKFLGTDVKVDISI